jgi:hypothetical protein
LVLAALAAIGVGFLTQRSDAGLQSSYPAAAADRTSADLGGYVLAAQAASDRVWALTCVQLCGAADTGLDRERLVELDARSGAVIRRLPPLTNLSAFTTAGHSVWVAHAMSGEITRINQTNGRTTARVDLRLPVPVAGHDRRFLPENLSYANGYVWASTARGWIAQIDARTGKLVHMVRTPSEDNSTTTDRYGTWVAENLDGVGLQSPHAVRLRIRAIMQAGLALDVDSMLSSGRTVWAIATTDVLDEPIRTVILVIEPRTDRVFHRVQVPEVSGAVVAGGAIYLGDLAGGRIYSVSRDGSLRVFSTPRDLAWLATASPGALWAALNVTPRQKRGRLLRIGLPLG